MRHVYPMMMVFEDARLFTVSLGKSKAHINAGETRTQILFEKIFAYCFRKHKTRSEG